MKPLVLLALLSILLTACDSQKQAPVVFKPWYPASNEQGDPLFAVFESRIPCADCEKIKFGLALFQNKQTKAPTTYMMSRIYVAKGNDRTVNKGNWTIGRGTKLDPQAIVYQLDENAPMEFRSYWAIGENILFILDSEMNPKVGDAGESYALNRTHPSPTEKKLSVVNQIPVSLANLEETIANSNAPETLLRRFSHFELLF